MVVAVCGAVCSCVRCAGRFFSSSFFKYLFLWFRSCTLLACTTKTSAASHTMNQPTNTVWMRLRTPALFGAGLYLGLMLFGRESKQGSEYFEGLRGMFEVRAPRSGGRVDTDNGSGGKS